jgi:lipopolysaccharide heptosyltransferase I
MNSSRPANRQSNDASFFCRSPRILILRLSALGDVILSLPVLCALRRAFPQAWIAWAVQQGPGRILADHPDLDERILVPKHWLLQPRAILALRRHLRSRRFDWAIDIQGLTKSAALGWLARASRQVTFATRDARELSPYLATDLVFPRKAHVVERNLELLQVLGIREAPAEFRLPHWPAAAETARQIRQHLGCTGPFAILNPGAGWPSKLWPTERFGRVAFHLQVRWQLPSLVLWAGAKEKNLAEQVVAASDGAAILAPPTGLQELAELCRQAAIFISADTGPLHLAAAVGTPCVGLYGPWPAERCGPYGLGHVAIQKMRLDAPSRCRRRASPIYMNAIDVPTVCAACDQILARKLSATAAA